MKKLPFLVGALGGALAGYLFNNNKLRDELAKAKDADAAVNILGKHLKTDGKKLGKEVQKFMKSDDVKRNVKQAKSYMNKQAKEWGKEVEKYMEQGAK